MKSIKSSSLAPKTWVLILNWKNKEDTIECLESILKSNDPAVTGVLLCDNGSNDGSIEAFQNWFQFKQFEYAFYEFEEGRFLDVNGDSCCSENKEFILIDNKANLGFAAGNNIGLRFIQKFLEYDYVFLLNNDTLVTDTTFSEVVKRFQTDSRIGLCGSKVIYEHSRDRVQALSGASFNPVLGRAVNIGSMSHVDESNTLERVEGQLDYILGAAMTISKPCLESIGGMEEKYFLYFEEIDWAVRAKRSGFKLGYASESKVFHKEGATIGSSHERSGRSLLSEYYMMNSRLKFTFKIYPQYVMTVILFSLFQVARSLFSLDFSRAAVQCRAILNLPRIK